jgi:hypothetical protein
MGVHRNDHRESPDSSLARIAIPSFRALGDGTRESASQRR